MGFRRPGLQDLDRRSLHLIVDPDVSLRRAKVLVAGELHDDLGGDAAVGKLGDETTAAAVAGCAVDPSPAIKLPEQWAQRVGRERAALLAGQEGFMAPTGYNLAASVSYCR